MRQEGGGKEVKKERRGEEKNRQYFIVTVKLSVATYFQVQIHQSFVQGPPQWNIITFPHKSYWFNMIASSDPNITTSPHKTFAIYTEEKTSLYYVQRSG